MFFTFTLHTSFFISWRHYAIRSCFTANIPKWMETGPQSIRSFTRIIRLLSASSPFHRNSKVCTHPNSGEEIIATFCTWHNSVLQWQCANILITWMNKEWCLYSSDEPFQRSREGYLGVYFPSCEATKEINSKITFKWAQRQFVTKVHTLFYFVHYITNL